MSDSLAGLQIVWEEKRPLPVAKSGAASVSFGRNLVVAGGTNWSGGAKRWLDSVDLYDFENDRWHGGPQLPRAFAYGCSVVSASGLEILGGCDSTGGYRDSWTLQSGSSTWRRINDAPQSFVFAAAANWSEHLHVFGGCGSDHDLTTAKGLVWMRDANYAWYEISTLPQRHIVLSAHACIDGKAYLFGGCSLPRGGTLANHDEAFSFDCGTHEWDRLRKLPSPRRGASAVALSNGSIAILGGYGASFLKDVLIYDPKRDHYEETTSLPFGLLGVNFVLHGDVIYGAGGEDRERGRSPKLIAGRIK
jgi:N-acetylneuraminic acid mutarotase